MQHLGVHWNLPLNRGLGFVAWDGEGQPGGRTRCEKGKPYPWMSEDGFAATMEQLQAMGKSSFEDMARLMRTPLQAWLEQRNLHPEAYDYIKVLAASQTAQAEPAMTPTGDFLGYMAIAGQIRMNLVSGSVATADEPGCIAIPQQFEQVLLAHGGTVLRGTRAREVLIEDGRVTGVRIGGEDNDYERRPRHPRGPGGLHDPAQVRVPRAAARGTSRAEWVELLERQFWGAGLLTGWCGMKRSVLPDIGLAEGSFVYMPGVIRGEGYIGAVDMVMCDFTAWGDGTARRGPPGKREYLFSTALTDEEMRNPDRVNRVIELCEDWARATFPTWDDDCEFMLWTPSPEAYGLWRPVGEDRPDVTSPWVEGLYFAGDQYGRRMWGGGVDGAALSAVMCVDAITGREPRGADHAALPPRHPGARRDERATRRDGDRRHRRGADRPLPGPGRDQLRARCGAARDPRRRHRQGRDRLRDPDHGGVQLPVQQRADHVPAGRGTRAAATSPRNCHGVLRRLRRAPTRCGSPAR